nr:MAG TPA: hypothetical protein [Caudoviricetes sp.]
MGRGLTALGRAAPAHKSGAHKLTNRFTPRSRR